MPDPERIGDPDWLAGWMRREEVTIAHMTPAMGQLLAESAAEEEGPGVDSLRYVFLVGDVLSRRDVARLEALAPNVTCVNFYGSTETQRAVGYHVASGRQPGAAKEILPLGRGIEDVQLLVLRRVGAADGETAPTGVGELGEVCVRSPHIALGYLGDPALTTQRFLTNPFTGEPGDRIYRTGDLGSYLPNGEVVFAGRADLQVKIRGFRIELGEIEGCLGRYPGVKEAVVVAREEDGEKRLVAYVVPGVEPAPTVRELRDFLRELLPEYMVPAAFVLLGGLPLTPNNKVDRRALPAPEASGVERQAYVAPRTLAEELLAGIWAEVLKVERVGVRDNFFELGGHSLLAVQVVSRVRAAAQIELPLRAVFQNPTIEGLAGDLEDFLLAAEEEAVAGSFAAMGTQP